MSGFRDFKKVANATEDTAKLQERLQEFFVPLQNCDLINGLQLTAVVLTMGTANLVQHKLGRELQGYIVTRNRADSRIWDSQDNNQFQSKTLALHSSADTVVDLWVY
jgi:hypothetical protein